MADKGKTYKTATGATQWTRDLDAKGQSSSTIRNLKDRVTRDFTKLSTKDFKDKYGSSYKSVMARLEAANSARASQNMKEIDGGKESSTSKMYDSWEKSDVSRYSKGGYANCGASMKPDGKRRK